MPESQPLSDTVAEPGDILLFYGYCHVAISMGNDEMLHLPSFGVFGQKSVTEFIDAAKSSDAKHSELLKNMAETVQDVSDLRSNDGLYDKICDYSEAVADLRAKRISPGMYALTKSRALAAASEMEKQLEVRVIKNPWGRCERC